MKTNHLHGAQDILDAELGREASMAKKYNFEEVEILTKAKDERMEPKYHDIGNTSEVTLMVWAN